MSGGVDSSVTAAILKQQGFDLVGITMRVVKDSQFDPSYAKNVAKSLGIEHHTIDISSKFKDMVIDYFVDTYLAGSTPNPCVKCNQTIKFDYLLELGKEFGTSKIATGHYARIKEFKGHQVIAKGLDRNKDQSYFLSLVKSSNINKIIFVLGDYSKSETRSIAANLNLQGFDQRESQEICFTINDDYVQTLQQHTNQLVGEGNILDINGKIIGTHPGFYHYTIGQRHSINVATTNRLYVLNIDAKQNEITVGDQTDLYRRDLVLRDVEWSVPKDQLEGITIAAKIRYRSEEAKATMKQLSSGKLHLTFDEPQKSVTPGQVATLYHDDFVIGGGWIE